jgi:DNA-binding response OmpR family regulator
MARVALIDDDSGLITVLDRRLTALGWDREVLGCAVAPEELATMRLNALIVNPAVTGLDYVEQVAVALPGLSLVVHSPPSTVSERVRGLRAGADVWITKPCHPEELIARLQAVLRGRRASGAAVGDGPITAEELAIRFDRFDAYVGEAAAGLSRKEFELLVQLAGGEGRVLEREDIYQRVWGYTMARGDRSVDVLVRKLRHKLELVSPGWRYVHTHFGVGYRFAAEPPGDAAAAPTPAAGTAPGAGKLVTHG